MTTNTLKAKTGKSTKMVEVRVRIPHDLKMRLKSEAVRQGVTMSELVRRALEAYL